jgi:hypothetical protein
MSNASLPQFYRAPRPLHAASDGDLSLADPPDYGFACEAATVPLVAGDFEQACKFYPIVFTLGEVPWPVAIVGLRPGRNMFVDDRGQWDEGVYIPAYVRRYPFIFLDTDGDSEGTPPETLLGVDEAAPTIVHGHANPLFRDGKPTEITDTALAFCAEYQAESLRTEAFARALAQAGLLVDKTAVARDGVDEDVRLEAFQTIDEYRLSLLPEDEALAWRDAGWLRLASCHLVSLANLPRLVSRLRTDPALHEAA